MPRSNLSGQRFGRWLVVSQAASNKNGGVRWNCICECGAEKAVDANNLRAGKSVSCGCYAKEQTSAVKSHDLTGRQFARLTVLERAPAPPGSKRRNSFWLCRCECGTIKAVAAPELTRGQALSCGCYLRDMMTIAKHKHGMAFSPEHKIWSNIKKRCLSPSDPAYDRYGGRGITICDRWRGDFSAFLHDMGPRPSPRHSIDRIDNDKGYEPGNCRWATGKEQGRNKRNNRLLTLNGETKTLSAWSESLGVGHGTIQRRIDIYGWSVEDALTTPAGHPRSSR